MATQSQAINTSPYYAVQLRRFTVRGLVTMFALLLLLVYLAPFANMIFVSLKDNAHLSQSLEDSILPLLPKTIKYQGDDAPILKVPLDTGVRELAIIKKGRASSQFVDPANPDSGIIEWTGNWRTLEPVQDLVPRWQNFSDAWTAIKFPMLFGNTLAIAVLGLIGTLLSCIAVAYAFATIILPSQVTLVPTYAFFVTIGWTGTWLPLIIPHFFANAYNVFLLRQYFMTLPRELDEAAMIDGAGPFRILMSVIIPQSWPVIVSVSVFHFVFAWNDYFAPMIYLIGKPDLQPISVAVQQFNFVYGPHPELIQATSLMAMVLPLVIFFLAQRAFMRGVVITGVEK
jgi:multiple sugar transport system permease protein